jgi:polyhydroxybutyrate depolymerase
MNNNLKLAVFFPMFIIALIFLTDISTIYAQEPLRQRIRGGIARKIQEKRGIKDDLQSGDTKKSILVGDIKRTYIVHLPAQYKEGQSYPLVFVLHGGTANAENAIRMSQMSLKADKEGFIVVYPNGTGKFEDKLLQWNDGSQRSGHEENTADDIAFFRQLISRLEKEHDIDPKRIYATGISNGGIMTYRLGCELSDVLAAIAPVAGALNYDKSAPTSPLSLIIFHGTADEYVPYNGGIGKAAGGKQRIDKSVAYAVDYWVKHNGCNPVPKKEKSGSIIKESYSGGKANTEVVPYTIKGGGHSWPGGINGLRYGNVNPPTHEISATDLIWEFFKKHPKE